MFSDLSEELGEFIKQVVNIESYYYELSSVKMSGTLVLSPKLNAVKCLLSRSLLLSSTAAQGFTINLQARHLTNCSQQMLVPLCSRTHTSVFCTRTASLLQHDYCYDSYQRTLTRTRMMRRYSTESEQNTPHTSSQSPESTSVEGEFELVYTAPLKGAVRAIKLFSLSTAAAAMVGGPVLVCMGNPSVPLLGRVIMSTLVMLVGASTTALLHWLIKGYVIRMYYNKNTNMIQLYTLSLIGRKKYYEFDLSEAKPPSATAFSSFEARGKGYFVHGEVFKNEKLLSSLLGVYADIERTDM